MTLVTTQEADAELTALAEFFGMKEPREAVNHGIRLLRHFREAVEGGLEIMLVPPEQVFEVENLGGASLNIFKL